MHTQALPMYASLMPGTYLPPHLTTGSLVIQDLHTQVSSLGVHHLSEENFYPSLILCLDRFMSISINRYNYPGWIISLISCFHLAMSTTPSDVARHEFYDSNIVEDNDHLHVMPPAERSNKCKTSKPVGLLLCLTSSVHHSAWYFS